MISRLALVRPGGFSTLRSAKLPFYTIDHVSSKESLPLLMARRVTCWQAANCYQSTNRLAWQPQSLMFCVLLSSSSKAILTVIVHREGQEETRDVAVMMHRGHGKKID